LHNSALNQINQDPSLSIKIQEDKNKDLITRLKEAQEKLTSAQHRIG
jgi:hypothetical protein